jgi:two-component system, OmpR family, alkaline phosphatase synthesis response regulator PhoP
MKTVLIIEDSRMMKTVAERDLTRAGYRVITAADGEQGLQCAQQKAPDLILLDILLPKITGLDVLRALKSEPQTKAIPVIVLTGLSKGNAEKLIAEGAAAFYEKSDQSLKTSSELIELIRSTLAKLASPGNKPV